MTKLRAKCPHCKTVELHNTELSSSSATKQTWNCVCNSCAKNFTYIVIIDTFGNVPQRRGTVK